MMSEVIERSVKKGKYPDVIIIDGGKGQVSVVKSCLDKLGVKIPVVGIAKAKTKSDFRRSKISATSERLVIPGRKK